MALLEGGNLLVLEQALGLEFEVRLVYALGLVAFQC
jgi:hypothetical protein